MTTQTCGCKIMTAAQQISPSNVNEMASIFYCPIHASAPEMLKAIKEHIEDCSGYPSCQCGCGVLDDVIAKAEHAK